MATKLIDANGNVVAAFAGYDDQLEGDEKWTVLATGETISGWEVREKLGNEVRTIEEVGELADDIPSVGYFYQ